MRNGLRWLDAPGAALTGDERRWLRSVAMDVESRFKIAVIVNLGIYKGASMRCLRAGAPAATLVGIDLTGGDLLWQTGTLKAEIVKGNVESAWRDFDREIHLLFFDADHRKEPMMIQLWGWAPLVAEGGIMAFHDYPLPEPRWGVKAAVDEWMGSARRVHTWAEVDAPDKLKAFRRLG